MRPFGSRPNAAPALVGQNPANGVQRLAIALNEVAMPGRRPMATLRIATD